jgi:uncharacterized protein YkwD
VPTPPRKRTRYIVLATCALGVLGAGFAGMASAQTTTQRPHAARHAPRIGAAATVARHHAAPQAAPAWRHRPGWPTTPPPTATPAPTTPAPPDPTTPAPTTPAPTTPAPTTPAPTTPAPTTPPPAAGTVIDQALAHINAARAANGLAPYTLSANLSKASLAHSQLMASGCGLSHQCPGEAGLGERFTAAGVPWTSAGENIGQGNAADNDASILAAANGLTDLMLAEVPPNDGHRRNLLNPGFKYIGLAVVRDSGGRVWLTQDFVN